MNKTTPTGLSSFRFGNLKSKIQNLNSAVLFTIVMTFVGLAAVAEAQQPKIYRVGVIHQGGPYGAVVDGLRDGLRQLGYEEGKQIRPGNPRHKE